MKAAIVEKPGTLVVRDVSEPFPGDYDALCEVLYGSTCTGTDLHIIEGAFASPVKYPTILGHESVGRVVKLGSKVRNYKIGDVVVRVGVLSPAEPGLSVTWGGFAEMGIAKDHWAMKEDGLPPEKWSFFRLNQTLPADLDPADATLVITWRENFSYITRMGVRSGARVLIIGSGGNGLSYVNHAANLQAKAIVLVGSPARLDLARKLGATACFPYDAPDIAALIRKSHPDGFDFIIDAVGKRGLLDKALPLLARGGTAGIYGVDDYGRITINPLLPGKTFTFYNGGYDAADAHDPVVRFIREGKLVAKNYYDADRIFPLEQIAAAFDALRKREMVKAVIRMRA